MRNQQDDSFQRRRERPDTTGGTPEPAGEVKPCTFLLKRQEKFRLAKPSGPRASNETLVLDLAGWVNDARMQDAVFSWSNFEVDNKDTSTQLLTSFWNQLYKQKKQLWVPYTVQPKRDVIK